MRRLAPALGLSAALALFLAAAVLGLSGDRRAEVSALPSAQNVGPRGLAAARELLLESGAIALRRGRGDPPVPGAGAVILAALSSPLSEDDVTSLIAEAEAGATLVVALGPARPKALLEALGVEVGTKNAPRLAGGLAPHPLLGDLLLPAGGASLSLSRPGGLAVSGGGGIASALSIPVGRGEVLVLSGPDPLENGRLLEGDAVSLALRLGGKGPVVFDERFLAAPGRAGPPREGLALLGAQVLLGGLALVLSRGRRLGAVRPPDDPGSGRTAHDYLASLAALYRRAGAEEELAREAWHGLRRRLERRFAIPAHLSDPEAARRAAGKSPRAALALSRGGAAFAGKGPGLLLEVLRAAADAEGALSTGRR